MSGERGPAEAAGGGRQARQLARQRAITEAVMAEGALRIDELAARFGISQMTVHRDLDELASLGVLRKQRGVATALATSLVESSDVYRANQQMAEKESLARAALDFISPGQALFLDDSTTVLQIAPHLRHRTPLTVITNVLTLINKLQATRNITLLGLGGQYYNWCSAFMGRMTIQAISNLQADTFIMSTAAITGDVAYHQSLETVDIKRAMFDAANVRILLADHTKFEKRALHALVPLSEFDTIIVDAATPDEHVKRMQAKGMHVVVAPEEPRAIHPTAEEQ